MGGMPRLLCGRERPGVIAEEAGWAPQPVHTGFENLTPQSDSNSELSGGVLLHCLT